MKYRVEVKRDICVGAGACVVLAPDFFKLDDAKKALLKIPEGTWTKDSVEYDGLSKEQVTALMNAAEACPVLAIYIFDENGNKIFPKYE